MKYFFGLITFVAAACSSPGQQQVDHTNIYNPDQFEGSFRPQVSVLGIFHFEYSDTHDYEEQFSVDPTTDLRKQQIHELIAQLATFKPTKILVEVNRIAGDSLLNVQYGDYLDDESRISSKSEIYQVAFPLAKKLSHKRVYASDAKAEWFGADLDWDHFDESAYLKSIGQYEKSNRYNYQQVYSLEDSLKSVLSIKDYLILLNTPEAQRYNHQIYLTETALSGAGDTYIGADAVARWYRRNLRIFANVLDLVDFDSQERILIIYGASHGWTLKQFFEDSPDFDYVEINKILTDSAKY